MIQVEGLQYAIDGFSINVDLIVEKGEYFVLLGMTGSGKTLFLENLCGLRHTSAGRVLLNGQDITHAEPRDRRLGYVPQDGALFEHLNVRRNLGFALEVKGTAKPEREAEVERIAELLHIRHLLDRRIRGLSGGERQRVALGRALTSRPEALVLDEPVSALDEYTRQAVCDELKRIQRALRLPVIHVCHSFEETKLMADRVGVMHLGRIIQTGTADELMNAPADRTVADILRLDNILQGEACSENGQSKIRCNGLTLLTPPARGQVCFIIKSWEIRMKGAFSASLPVNTLAGTIMEITVSGFTASIRTQGEIPLVFHLSRHTVLERKLQPGDRIQLSFLPEAVHIFQYYS